MAKYHSDKLLKRKRKIFYIKVSFLFGFFLILFLSFAGISRINYLNIQNTEIKGNKVLVEKDLQNIINNKMNGNYWLLFSKKNILIYPKQKIKDDLLAQYSLISSVDISLNLPNTLKVKINEREPYVLWCDDNFVPTEDINEKCFFADNKGYIYSKAPNFSEKSIFKHYSKLKQANPIRASIFDESKFKEIDSFRQFIDGLGLSSYKLIMNPDKSCEIYFGNGGKIIFDLSQNLIEVSDNLQSILNAKDFENKDFLWKLEYIDLRFGNKVFYK